MGNDYRSGTDLWKQRKTDSSWDGFLHENEHLLWQGRPAGGLSFDKTALLQSGFGLFFLLFALVWISMATTATGISFFSLLGVPFVLVGAYACFGHLFWDAYKRKRTRYALTNERALIAKQTWSRQPEGYPVNAQTEITYREQGRSLASVLFAKNPGGRWSEGQNTMERKHIGFRWIGDGKEIYRLMHQIQSGRIDDRSNS